MTAAIIGLVGAVIGGLLVTAGDMITHRIERKTALSDQLRVAAADVIASYLHARSHLIAVRTQGHIANWNDVWPDDRHLAMARFFTLPGSAQLHTHLIDIREATIAIYNETLPERIEANYDRQMTAIRAFEARMRQLAT